MPPPAKNLSSRPSNKKRTSEEALPTASSKRPRTNNAGAAGASAPKTGKATPTENRAANQLKVREIRSIAVQESDAALKDGELNVQSFLNARGFELKALDESMRRTRVSNSTRAFQRVPITLRRRAAAHNYKRVPKRLQKRAQREMVQDKTPIVNSRTRKSSSTRSRLRAETAKRLGLLVKNKKLRKLEKAGVDKDTISVRAARPKIRRNALNEPPVNATKFRKRQLEKTWLPTHLWHTKRARMMDPKEPLWRFATPLTPTAKCYRPTHRMQWEKGAIAWDMSYMSTLGLSGPFNSVRNVLKALGLTQENLWNEKASCWRQGAVHWTCTLSRRKQSATQIIGPATIIWNSEAKIDGSESSKTFRQLFIRIHPSAFLELFDELVRLVKKQTPRAYIEDLRHEIGSIEITGPDSTESLLGILKPYVTKSHPEDPHASKFSQLTGCRDAASLPPGTLLGFSIMDPRLNYPPQKVPPTKADVNILGDFHQNLPTTPFNLFDRDTRFKGSRLPSQKSLNRRKGKGVPGARLEPTSADPPIPLLLLASRHPTNSQAPGTWTLMLPWKCVLPVWYSLMHYPLSSGGNPRFGGVDEIRQLAFERGLPWFPGDFPGTDAGNAWELGQRQARQKKWERRPKGKRTNYETLDLGAGRKGEVGVGWNCDWELLLGLNRVEKPQEKQVDNDAMDVDGVAVDSGPQASKRRKPRATSQNPLESLVYLPKSAFNAHLSPNSEPPPPTSLITVHIRLLGRGTRTTCARIYKLPSCDDNGTVTATTAAATQAGAIATGPPPHGAAGAKNGDVNKSKLPRGLRAQWLAQKPSTTKTSHQRNRNRNRGATDLEARKLILARELVSGDLEPTDGNQHPVCPDAEDLIGFVTAGTFSLRDGRGTAVGALAARVAAEELRHRGGQADARLCVVRNAGEAVGRLARWEIV